MQGKNRKTEIPSADSQSDRIELLVDKEKYERFKLFSEKTAEDLEADVGLKASHEASKAKSKEIVDEIVKDFGKKHSRS